MPLSHVLFGFTGRINRGKFWLAILIYIGATIVFTVIISILTAGAYLDFASGRFNFSDLGFAAILYILFGVVAFLSQLAVTIKRLHDRDKSGWWVLLLLVAPWVLSIVALTQVSDSLYYYGGANGSAAILMLAALALYIWAFVELGCLRGTIGPNRFGSDPIPMLYYGAPGGPQPPPYPGQFPPQGQPYPGQAPQYPAHPQGNYPGAPHQAYPPQQQPPSRSPPPDADSR
ncbi:MAG: DUF805 domain-containing protein [Bauldia sp.]|nr:DUF805 domain-containing protein [Bauldia sp.]